MDKLNAFLASVYVTIGQVKGRTLLPLPPSDVTSSERTSSKDKVHVLESAVITWTKQIKNVLKLDPEAPLKAGLNPDPLVEIDFWKSKAANLNAIHEQLQMERVKKVLRYLEANKSTYTTPFSKLQREVNGARLEANDNYKYLRTLLNWFGELNNESKDFQELMALFKPIMHLILLIWNNSRFYTTPARLVVLIREICNAIIKQACRYISGPQVFAHVAAEEAHEAVEKLKTTLKVCGAFKSVYFDYKARANADADKDKGWKIQNNALFVRLDSFLERCHDILDFAQTVVQFSKLSKIEIGGTKGKTLTTSVSQIFIEFQQAVDSFRAVSYDIMDVGAKKFDDDFYTFRCRIKELERRLGSVLTQGFDDCDTIYGRFKLLDSFEGLLERPIIQDELEKKHITLIESYKVDLKAVQVLFMDGKPLVDRQDEKAPIYDNLPPIAGALTWSRALLDRIQEPMEKLQALNKSILDREEFKEVEKLYSSLRKSLKEYEETKISEWEREVETSSRDKLKQPLLRRDTDGVTLRVNFDPALVRLLREVKYFLLLDLAVPPSAQEIYAKAETYRNQTGNLELIVNMYNGILSSLLKVEEPLLIDRIQRMDTVLLPGLKDLKWRSSNISEFIQSSMQVVKEVNGVVSTLKENLKKIKNVLKKWSDVPMLERKAKPMIPEDFETAQKSSVAARHNDITEGGKEIHKLLKDSGDGLKVAKGSAKWKAYVDYVNNIVTDGFAQAVIVSLRYLAEQIDPQYISKFDLLPIFDVRLDLVNKNVIFDPPLDEMPNLSGVRDIVNGWITDFFKVGTLMTRLDTGNGDYLNELKDHMEIQNLLAQISYSLDDTESECNRFRESYVKYKYLWTDSIQEAFSDFIASANVKKKEDEEEGAEEEEEGSDGQIRQKMPSLSVFDEKITYYRSIQSDISDLKTPVDIGWIRINPQPIKASLIFTTTKWTNTFTSFLSQHVTDKLNGLQTFMTRVSTGLQLKPQDQPENKDLLMEVMTHIRDIRLSVDSTNAMFGPLRDQLALLKKHGIAMPDAIVQTLEAAPAAWEESVRTAFEVKAAILPLQTQETNNVKRTIDAFRSRVETFRSEFLKCCPFSDDWEVEAAYKEIDAYHHKVLAIDKESKEYNNLETLFELQTSGYRQLRDCRKELQHLKMLWDQISMVNSIFDAWKNLLWDKIDTDALLDECKIINNQIKVVPKEIRGWRSYVGLVDSVKNMSTVLPLINDLHSEFMRDRHWKELMRVTGKVFQRGPTFCLEDLLSLKLFKYVDDVSELVDMSMKEAKIEKKLKMIENSWVTKMLTFEEYKDTKLLCPLDEIIETLEQHSMDLMSMMSQGKFVEFFKDQVGHWLKTLRKVDSVLTVWVKVQKNWKRLETIFLASEDIRSQLPEDTKRFEELDIEWKEVMADAGNTPQVVDACVKENMEEKLMKFHQIIESCEKSLNDYLEQKKKAFPRFYFVSNQALLDILSNGNNPQKVAEYLGDCFDGMKSLIFEKDASGKELKTAHTMISKEGEIMPLNGIFKCEGAVEVWLKELESAMKHTLRESLEVAKNAADNWEVEKPRDQWLFDYCAQISLIGTQIIWTEEMHRTFEDLEGGAENAMKDYKRISDDRIEKLIKLVQGDLTPDARTKIITIITIDVHARDVVERFVLNKITDGQSFAFQSQLRFYWQQKTGEENKTCVVRIADWSTTSSYEYVGNCGRLVITPLTDRCYITLAQALNLIMGGAPAGPAGTGKTETVKDMGRALALPVMVFNCSEQMNYQSMAQIFMGLAQSGAWGCFDEFNRINIEVLSVISTQVKTVLDAIKEKKKKFQFMDEEISLNKTCGFFITMNPGYAGRTELPENLKALFRSCAMVVPDLVLICENMLLSEGFIKARLLALKFVTLYSLSKELLSKQIHYDWGLRAVKSVLRMAGKLKRSDPSSDEDTILMRALRDFNKPKIVSDDRPIFFRLIEDLFPGIKAEPKRDVDFEKKIKHVAKAQGLQPEDGFVLKVVQLAELLDVRHCVFVIGPTGCGKTAVWQTLAKTWTYIGQDSIVDTVNPKAVTSNELFGMLTKTKEWKDGVLSNLMRNMSKEMNGYKASHIHKWIILDGDVDPEWIESLNTVMDDNKVLTLVSNERVPLSRSMRLLFEVATLRNATPATVSRGGVLFINDTDVGWKPYMESWIERVKDENAKSVFYLCFAQFFEANVEMVRKTFRCIVPHVDMACVQSICCLLDSILADKANTDVLKGMSVDDQKNIFEAFFIYAAMWGMGGGALEDKTANYKKQFSAWFRSLSKIKFPEQGEVFDYYFDPAKIAWAPWSERVPEYVHQDVAFTNIVVSTLDTIRLKYLLQLHVHRKKPILFVGSAGTGKTTVVKEYLTTLNPEEILFTTVNLNAYTDSLALQRMLEAAVEKRTGKTFGPPGNKRLIYFVDDLNMPALDKYGTQSPIALIRQHIDYLTIFDRDHLDEKKEIQDVLFVGCMNPKAGSFNIDIRLQRHFTVLSCLNPASDVLQTIYGSILAAHMSNFDPAVSKISEKIVAATIEIFRAITESTQFLPSAKKFHYQFNLRDIGRVFQGLLLSTPNLFRGAPVKFVRLWLHECTRVFKDRLINENDLSTFSDFLMNACKKQFEEDQEEMFSEPLIFTSFMSVHAGNDKAYVAVKDMPTLKKVLEEKLADYNDNFAIMNLVLFDMAMEHVTRICRIIDQTAGHALCVGVGGSGKQSLARLAAFILKMDVIQIVVAGNYGVNELKLDLQDMYKKAAIKPGTPYVFILTDSQIADERFLVYINDLLASGFIPDLFTKDEMDMCIGGVRNEAKAAGFQDSRDALIKFFIEKVRRNLKVVLAFSPVGDAFRIRARKFPGLINATTIDWYHPWPKDALIGVGQRFLEEVAMPSQEMRDAIAFYMAEVHLSIDDANAKFLALERRYNYTTPKSFLELIEFYKSLLSRKRKKNEEQINRLDTGLTTLQTTKAKVEDLRLDLEHKMVRVEDRKKTTNALIEQMGVASAIAEEEQRVANIERDKTKILADKASVLRAQADGELGEAMPAMERAKEAIDCLTKASIQELKSLPKPPVECLDVTKACLILRGDLKNHDWKNAQKMMANPQKFIDDIKSFNAEEIDENILTALQPVLELPFFNFETMIKKSSAAAYLCNWVVNITTYNRIYKKVKPLMDTLKEATESMNSAMAALAIVEARVAEVEARLFALRKTLMEAEEDKAKVEAEANSCLEKLQLAARLTNGLADENKRWGESIEQFRENSKTLVGDVLLASAFVSYIGAFSAKFRQNLWMQKWSPELKIKEIPHSTGVDPLDVLANDSDIAKWKNEGLPADRISLENASVITSCARWPLMIDPQLQGQKWIRGRVGDDLIVIQLTQEKWMKKVEQAVTMGRTLMIENVGSEIDATLEPLLTRATYKRSKTARNYCIKLGGEELDYDQQFKLFLQSKLANPHYRPEIAAQCTIINFIVTETGLEDQLLAMVVNVERPELEQSKQELVRKQNSFKVELARLEDLLLERLSDADPATILSNIELIDGLEQTKRTALDIAEQSKQAQITELKINESREIYRRVAAEGAMLYFLLIQLCIINHMYQYSLDSFTTFFFKAIERTEQFAVQEDRVLALRSKIREIIFTWVNRGLFEKHKLIFSSLMTFRLMQKGILPDQQWDADQFNFLVRCPLKVDVENPLSEWLPTSAWHAVQSLISLPGFESFAVNMERDAPNRFKDWINELAPETAKLPLDWKKLDQMPFQKLLVIRCLRPDRMTVALAEFIRVALPNGDHFVDCDAGKSFADILSMTLADSSTTTPIFFILSPGADPVKEVEKLGKKKGFLPNVGLFNVALGQGQDVVAMRYLEAGHKEGHWVMLQNIHLMPAFLINLEKKLDAFAAEGSHVNFRVYLSAEPSNDIPIGVMERSIKLTNEPPQGLKPNLKRAFTFFTKEEMEDKDTKIKSVLFGLCFFHAIMIERKKFGAKGWNQVYSFNMGDLRDSALVLNNYLEANQVSGKIPWDDLRYIFGEIMYGGHIVDDWDRRLCATYLQSLMKDELLDEVEMFPFNDSTAIASFKSPIGGLTYDKYLEHIDLLPSETPIAFGLHPNAEIGFRTAQCNYLFQSLMELQPRDSGGDDEGGAGGMLNKVELTVQNIWDELHEVKFDLDDINSRIPEGDKGPYQYVFLQECEYMNILLTEMMRSLAELDLGFKGELQMSDLMEALVASLFMDRVPDTWAKLAYPSLRPLGTWLSDLNARIKQLSDWTMDPTNMPKVIFLPRLFNPQSFLTAIKQVTAQKQTLELNKLFILTEVTKRTLEEVDAVAREGSYVHGLCLEGARWDTGNNRLDESKPKEMYFTMPIINCKAQMIASDGKEEKNIYQCPVYKTANRGPTFVFTAQLRTTHNPGKWISAGVALILDPIGL